MPLTPGQTLQQRYQIRALLGQGGMGAVYRAQDGRLDISVAIKELLPQPGLDAQMLTRLRGQFTHAPYVEGSPEFPCADANTPAQCPPTPKRGFGTMWCDIPEIRRGLGNAVDCERGYQGSMQRFESGFTLRSDTGSAYVLYDDGLWERR